MAALTICSDFGAPKIKYAIISTVIPSTGHELMGKAHGKMFNITSHSVQFRSVAQSCPTLCDPMNHSTPGLPVHHQLLEFTQTHVH